MKTQVTLATAAFLLAAAPQSRAAISMVISDDGTNLTMSATGTYSLADTTDSGGTSPLGVPAVVAALPTVRIFGWETGEGIQYYMTTASGDALSGTANALTPTVSSASLPFYIDRGYGYIVFNQSAPVSGTVNNTATFNGVTLASLGMVAGQTFSGSWGTGGPDKSFTLTTIPEPSAILLGGLGGLAFLRRKR